MSSQNFSRTISYKGQFDASGIIKGLQQIRQQLGQSTTNQSLFINVDKELERVNNLSKYIQAAIQKGFSNPQDLKNFEKAIGQLEASLGRVSSKLHGIDTSLVTQSINRANTELTTQERLLKETIRTWKAVIQSELDGAEATKGTTSQIIQAAKEGKKLKDVQAEIVRTLREEETAQRNVYEAAKQTEAEKRSKVVDEKSSSFLKRVTTTSFTDLGTKADITPEQLERVRLAYNQLLKTMTSGEQAKEKTQALQAALQNLGIQIKKFPTIEGNFKRDFEVIARETSQLQSDTQAAKIQYDTAKKKADDAETVFNSTKLAEAYGKIVKQANEVTKAEEKMRAERANKGGRYTTDLQRQNSLITQQFNNIKRNTQATREAAQAQQQYDNTFENLKRYIQYTFSLTNGFRMLRRVISKTLTDIKNLDKSFADIAMVTDYSVAEMWESYDQYAQMANELGQSTQDVIKASGLFYQQGLDTAESLALTTETMKLATLAGIDFEEATSQMTAAIRGFNMEMDEGQRVTDVYSELAAKAAADVEGIAYAMSKTASIANSAGMSFENTAAFLTQMIETTQEAPENIG